MRYQQLLYNYKYFCCLVPTTTPGASTTPGTPRTTSEGEIITTTTPGEVCEKVLGMDDPQLVPDRFIEVNYICMCDCVCRHV